MANIAHGSQGSAKVANTVLCLTGWDVEEITEMADVTTTCSGGYHELWPGLKSLSATLNGIWDLSNSPMANPPSLNSGTKLTNVYLIVNGTSQWTIPTAYVESFKATVDVNDVIKWTASIKSSGSYTLPS